MATIEREEGVVRVPDSVPVLPLRDVVIFPGMVTPLLVGRPRSLAALDEAMKGDRLLLVLTQRQMNVDDPAPKDLYEMGTVVKILQLMRLVEGTMRILVEGVSRGQALRFHKTKKYLRADVRLVTASSVESNRMEAMVRSVSSQFTEYVQLNKRIPDEILRSVLPIEDSDRLADSIDYRALYRAVTTAVERDPGSAPHLLETVAERVAEGLLELDGVESVVVRCRKPRSVLPGHVGKVEIEIERP